MQLLEAKAMSEWLARYIVIRIQSKSRSRPRDKYHVSLSHILNGWFLWQTSRSYYYYSQDCAGILGMEESCRSRE